MQTHLDPVSIANSSSIGHSTSVSTLPHLAVSDSSRLINSKKRFSVSQAPKQFPALLCVGLKDLSDVSSNDALVSKGLTDYNKSDYNVAIARLQRAAKNHPNSSTVHFLLGNCFAKKFDWRQSLKHFTVCCRLSNGGNSNALYNRGLVRCNLMEYTGAVKDLTRAIKLEKSRDFYATRALIHRRNGDYKKAQKDYIAIKHLEVQKGQEVLLSEIDSGNEAQRRKMSMGGSAKLKGNGNPSENKDNDKDNDTNGESSEKKNDVDKKANNRNKKQQHLDKKRRRTSKKKKNGSPPPRMTQAAAQRADAARQAQQQADFKLKVYGMVHVALMTPPAERTAVQLDMLVKESSMMIAFQHLEPGQLRELWKHFAYKKFTSNVRIFEQGDDADVFYVVYSGSVSARIPSESESGIKKKRNSSIAVLNEQSETTINVMNAGETLGEAVGGNSKETQVRKASCVTEQPTELLLLDQKGFDATFKKFFQRRDLEKVLILKRNFNCFSDWPTRDIAKFAEYCREHTYAPGATIVKQGSTSQSLFFVEHGLVNVMRGINAADSSGKVVSVCEVLATRLTSGEIFGEEMLLQERGG